MAYRLHRHCFCRCVKVWCTSRRAVYVVVVVCVVAFLVTLPEFFEFVVIERRSSTNSHSRGSPSQLVPALTEFGSSAGYQLGYNYFNQSLFTFLPLFLLFVFNSLLVRAVLSAARLRHAMTGSVSAQREASCQNNEKISFSMSHTENKTAQLGQCLSYAKFGPDRRTGWAQEPLNSV